MIRSISQSYWKALAVILLVGCMPMIAKAEDPLVDIEGIQILQPMSPNPAWINQKISGKLQLHFYKRGTHEETVLPGYTKVTWHIRSVSRDGTVIGSGNVSLNPTVQTPPTACITTLTVEPGWSQKGTYDVVVYAVVESTKPGPPWGPLIAPDITVTIKVTDIRITAVEFTSDHNVLKDKDDNYQDGGARYHTVEWQIGDAPGGTAPVNDPMTHTWDEQVALKVTVETAPGIPAPGNIDITGSGLGDFSLSNQAGPAAGGMATYTITATNKLDKKIDVKNEPINWTINQAGGTTVLLTQATGPHKIYVLAGQPQTSMPTLKRINWVTNLAKGATDLPGIGDKIGPDAVSESRFDPNKSIFGDPHAYSTAWTVMDGRKADCATLSTLMKLELDLLGATGAEVKYVFARHAAWDGLVGNAPQYALMEHRIANNDSTRLGFTSGGWNNYEGCCVFQEKWWMGGAGSFKSKPVDVLHLWVDPNNNATGNHQYYHDQENVVQSYPPPPEPN